MLVVPPNSLSVGLAGKTLEMVTAIAQAINVPLLVLTARRYVDSLPAELDSLELELSSQVTRLGGNVVQDVASKVGLYDLVVVTTAGSQRRFRSSLGHVPEQLAAATSGSMVVIRYPR